MADKSNKSFKRGEVVFYKTRRRYVKVTSGMDSEANVLISDDRDPWANIAELRKLTKREKGTQ